MVTISPTPPDDPSAPRPAATLVLLRDSERGPEVLLTTRPPGFRFMGGATVFPGGALDAADLDARWEQASTIGRTEAAALLAPVDGALALGAFVAAMREAFEEVGWAPDAPARALLDQDDAHDPALFLARCLEAGLELPADRLVPAGRWVTPQGSPIRFDTFFFVADAGPRWAPRPDPDEVAEAVWATPSDALAQQSAGERLMAPPTIEMLQRLDGHDSVRALLESLRPPPSAPGAGATRLSPLVQVVVAPNPGAMTGPGTNTYIVGASPSTVIDPAVDDRAFIDAVAGAAGDVSAILVTHRHSDHVGGAAALAARTGAPVRAWGSIPAGAAPVEPLEDGDLVGAGGARLLAIHTPGHSSDHLCFWLEGAASLFSGDSILGQGTAVIAPPDGDMSAYMESLRRLRSFRFTRIYPGHWPPLDGGIAVVDGYIAHRLAREAAIVAALEPGPSTIEEIVTRAYADTPRDLHPIAEYSARAHLQLLEATGRARRVNDHWVLVVVD